MKYARIIDNVVFQVYTPPEGVSIEECFVKEFADLFEPCPEEVDQHWVKNEDGTYVAPPPPPEIPSEKSETSLESEVPVE